nr:C2 calcium-dependent domain-containing protein 6-like [Ciona intestinalis]|eukprot:XP_009859921.2 C2 calcium-dependent domain-containing protein 6-like [Ciona intestinalis]
MATKGKEAIDLKAAAAAKLVLQELDPVARKRRQEFSSGLPQGVIGIHAKTLRNFSKTFFFTSTFAGCTEIRLFLRITVQGAVKCSKIVEIRRDATNTKSNKLVMNRQSKLWSRRSVVPGERIGSPGVTGPRDSLAGGHAELTLDELKTFSLILCKKYDDPRNLIKLELIEVDSHSAGLRRGNLNVGFATLHLHDIIKEMYTSKSVFMMVKDKRVAELDLEYVFRYGTLGYGYSHQLKHDTSSLSHIMSESMFFKVLPPPERRDDEGFLEPLDLPQPEFIPFKKEEGDDEREKKEIPSSSSLLYMKVDTSNVTRLIQTRKRLSRMRNEYLELTTRHDRTRYLQSVVARLGARASGVDTTNDDDADDDDPDDGSPRQLAGMPLDARRQSEAVKAVIGNLSPLLLMAAGLQERGSRSGVVRRRAADTALEDSDNDSNGELNSESGSRPGTSESQKRPEEPTEQNSETKPEGKKGLMKLLRRKVLVPMRLKKMMDPANKPAPKTLNVGQNEEQASSDASTAATAAPQLLSLLQKVNRVSASDDESKSDQE